MPITDANAPDLAHLDEPARRDLVAEALHIFGPDAAWQLADRLAVSFDTCREAVECLERRLF